MKRYVRMFSVMLLGLCLFAGCGREPGQEGTSKQNLPGQGTEAQITPTKEPLQPYDWKNEHWKPFEEKTNGQQLSVIEYIPFDWEEPDFSYVSKGDTYASFRGDLYLFRRYWLEGGVRYFMYKLEGDTKEVSFWELDAQKTGLTANIVSSMQPVSEEELVFFTLEVQDSEVVDCHAVHVSMKGEFLYQTSLLAFYQEYAPFEKSSLGGIMSPIDPIFDSKGNSYYHDAEGDCVYKIDKNGAVTTLLDFGNDKKVFVPGTVSLPDGSVAFRVSDNNTWEGKLLWANGESDTLKSLAVLERAYLENACVSEYGLVYYVSNYKLYRWNIRTGVCESMFDFKENNISSLQYVLLDVNNKGEVLLYQYSGDEKCTYVLSEKSVDVSEQKVLTIAALTYDSSYLKGCAASYSRKNPGTKVQYETQPSEVDAERIRILADITAGGGPDMLWVNGEDMRILQEKGAICNLEELIDEETLAQIFPGILASGIIDGQLVGLVTEACPVTMFTAKSTWAESSWGALDILELLEKGEPLEGLFWYWNDNQSAETVLRNIVCFDMTDSPFIDFETGESRFEREEFVRLLELVKQYEQTQPEGSVEKIQQGQFLAVESYMASISTFCQEMRRMGEDCHLVGMPAETDYVGNWMVDNFLVVNQNSPYKEEIAGYLEELLCLQNQRNTRMNCVRRDVIEESMIVPEWSSTPQYKTEAGTYLLLEAKPDGTPYFDEYLDFLDNCGPNPYGVEVIEEIFNEEVESFCAGGQSAEKTADNIDRRVQIYLDERN